MLALSTGTAAASCTPLPCSQAIVGLPHALGFGSDHGGIRDSRGVGTGFTYALASSAGGGYAPEKLVTGDGFLQIRTGSGINHLRVNSLENALAVGVTATTTRFTVQTTLDRPPVASGRWEQAGLWVGTGEDDYVKLVLVSTSQGPAVQLYAERSLRPPATGATAVASRRVPLPPGALERLRLVLRADAVARTVDGLYAIDGGPLQALAPIAAPESALRRPPGSEPELAGSRFAGVFATHRRGAQALQYRFDDFAVCTASVCPEPASDPDPDGGPQPGPGPERPDRRPAPRPSQPGNGGSHAGGTAELRETVGSLAVSLRHPRRVRIARLVSRGLRVRLRCSEVCGMRAALFGSGRRWLRGPGIRGKAARLNVGARRARLAGAGQVAPRLRVRRAAKRALRRATRARLTLRVPVRDARGRTVVLRGVVIARR
jgi:hypothetical protein